MRLKTKFLDEDFDFGEVVEASIMYGYEDKIEVYCIEKMKHRKYDSIKDFTDHWEDAPEEPRGCWIINVLGIVEYTHFRNKDEAEMLREIGNRFETREEAEKAAERLRAWKRLKDKGFRFDGWTIDDDLKISICTNFEGDNIYSESEKEIRTNLDLLFGGEE